MRTFRIKFTFCRKTPERSASEYEAMQTTSKYHATAYFKRATEFLGGADELLTSNDRHRWYPTYFLYGHAAELALKAFLRAHDPEVEYGHDLTVLYEKCRAKGLIIGQNDQTQIGNIVNLLDSANKDQGLRYFLDTNAMPELTWTRDIVTQLVEAVKPYVEKAEKENPSGTGKLTKLMIIWGKPVPK
jgi:HEPN domain-containing protein